MDLSDISRNKTLEYCPILSHFMNEEDKRNPKNWTKEESDRVVAVFQWLLDQDREQNPHLYTKKATLEKGRLNNQKESK